MRKFAIVALLAIAVFAIPSAAAANQSQQNDQGNRFVANLTGDQERPTPVTTEASGRAVFRLQQDGKTVKYRVVLEDIHGVFAAHIHAPSGPNDFTGVKQFLCGSSSVGAPPGTPACSDEGFRGSFVATPMLLFWMENGLAYANVHTPSHPGGEIRGHILVPGTDEEDD